MGGETFGILTWNDSRVHMPKPAFEVEKMSRNSRGEAADYVLTVTGKVSS